MRLRPRSLVLSAKLLPGPLCLRLALGSQGGWGGDLGFFQLCLVPCFTETLGSLPSSGPHFAF